MKFRDSNILKQVWLHTNTAAAIFLVPEVGGVARGGGNAPVSPISNRHWKNNEKKKKKEAPWKH